MDRPKLCGSERWQLICSRATLSIAAESGISYVAVLKFVADTFDCGGESGDERTSRGLNSSILKSR
jgi:hypothetical protein